MHLPTPLAELRDAGRYEELVHALLARLEGTQAPNERAALLYEIGATFEKHLDDPAQAFDAMLEAWRLVPDWEPVLEPLETLARTQNRFHELVVAGEALARQERAPARALVVAETMVRWLTRDVPDPERARAYLDHIRSIDRTHWTLHLFQAALSREHGDLKRELEDLDRAVLSARRADDRARIHLVMASRYLEPRTSNLAEAKKHFEAAKNLVPRSMEALKGLETVSLATEDYAGLAETLHAQADAEPRNEAKVEILMRLAELYEKRFLKPDRAAHVLERVLGLAPLSVEALESLERCYHATRNWAELVTAFEQSVVMNDEPRAQASRLRKIADIQETRLGDLAAARWAYDRLRVLEPNDPRAVAELARLSEKMGELDEARKYRERVAELTPDPAAKARVYASLGQLLSATDPSAAREYYEKAAELDPTLEAAWTALLWSARNEGDESRVLETMERHASASDGPRQRAQRFIELAEARAKAGDDEAAHAAYERAYQADPDNEKAAQALVEAFVAAGQWDEAARLHRIALAAADRDRDVERRFTLLLLDGQILSAQGNLEGALAAQIAAFDLRSSANAAQLGLIAAAAALSDRPDAVRPAKDALEAIAKRPAELPPDWLAALGDLLVVCGETALAGEVYGAALDVDPNERTALSGLARVSEMDKDIVVATALRRRLAHTLEGDDEKIEMLARAGESLTTAGKLELAVQAYEEARSVRPDHRPVLHALLDLYTKLEDWKNLAGVLRSIADGDDDQVRRSKVVATLGALAADKLGDPKAAANAYNEALDLAPDRLEVFEKLVTLRTALRDWSSLERDYRRMIHRTREKADLKLTHALFHQLGLVFRDRLKDRAQAIACFRAATELAPDDATDQAILRELLTVSGNLGDAFAVAKAQLLREPLNKELYPPLLELAPQVGENDRARAAYLGYELLRALDEKGSIWPQAGAALPSVLGRNLSEMAMRDLLLHPELDPRLTRIFQIVTPAVLDLERERMPLRQRMAAPGRALGKGPGVSELREVVEGASALFGQPAPKLFVAAVPGRLLVPARLRSPALFVDVASATTTPRPELAFLAGKRVFELTPALMARAHFPTVGELRSLVATAVQAVVGNPKTDPLRGKLRPEEAGELARLIHASRSAEAELDVKRWAELADVSTSRAGLLVCGDPKAARAALAREPQLPTDLPAREQLRELLAFLVGDAHALLRYELGVAALPPVSVSPRSTPLRG